MYSPIPIAPDKNKGPALLVKEIRCFASLELINFLFLKSVVTFAPIGYPPVIPKNKAIDEIPGSLKTKFIKGDRRRENIFVIAVCCRSSEIIRNGRIEGTIIVDQIERADLVDESISVGNMIQKIAIKKTKTEKTI